MRLAAELSLSTILRSNLLSTSLNNDVSGLNNDVSGKPHLIPARRSLLLCRAARALGSVLFGTSCAFDGPTKFTDVGNLGS
jgi:hypothetical protein